MFAVEVCSFCLHKLVFLILQFNWPLLALVKLSVGRYFEVMDSISVFFIKRAKNIYIYKILKCPKSPFHLRKNTHSPIIPPLDIVFLFFVVSTAAPSLTLVKVTTLETDIL